MDERDHWSAGARVLPLPKSLSCKIKHLPLKRIFDIIFSCLVIFFSLPLLILIALAIKFTSKGPTVFSQERIGRGGHAFRCYKFRTMYADAESRLNDILNSDPVRSQEWELFHKLKDDPRVTPFGSFLRRTSLDELPQFFNVLKGDLSVVGPRPVVHVEIEKHYGPKAHKILSIRPGITGIWQISGRSDLSYPKRIALDEQYVESRSIFTDVKIILWTIPSMISSRGAY